MFKIKKINKIIAAILALAIGTSFALYPASAKNEEEFALISKNGGDFTGSAKVKGDALVTGGSLTGSEYNWFTGHLYKTENVSVDNKTLNVESFSGETPNYSVPNYNPAPDAVYFVNVDTEYQDGTKDIKIGWGSDDFKTNYTIEADSYIDELEISNTLTLNIKAEKDQVRLIRVNKLKNNGSIKIVGGGKVILYVDDLDMTNGTINYGKKSTSGHDNFTIFITANDKEVVFDNCKVTANIISANSSVRLNNFEGNGNIYTGKNFKMTNSGSASGFVFAPNSNSAMENSTEINGGLITNTLQMSGNTKINYGDTGDLPSDIVDIIQKPTQSEPDPDEGEPGDEEDPDEEPDPAGDGFVTITAVVARRMSIRLEDGKILKDGDTFVIPKYGTVKFQVCTNNWDTDTYSDNGQGFAGTKVYEFTHQKYKEKYLRVDNDRFFRPVKFHFKNGDYLKLTGVDNVLSTPLESLSINFPLGTTVNDVNAYVNGQVVSTADIFIDSSLEWHVWEH